MALAFACWLPAGPAAAHAVLESSSPADAQQLDTAPTEISLQFSEPVTAAPGGVRLFDARGVALPVGAAAQGAEPGAAETVRVVPDEPLADGSYVVTWRVVSADGHPVAGAFVFSVGDPDQVDASLMRQVFAGGDDPLVGSAVVLVRWLGYLALLVAAGGVAFLAWVAEACDRARLGSAVTLAAAIGAVAALLSVPAQAVQLGGGFAAGLRAQQLNAALEGSVGVQAAVQALALLVVAFAVRHGGRRALHRVALPAAVVAVLTLVVAGHTRTTTPAPLVMAADALHAAAAASWLGGLVLLALALRRRRFADDPVGAARTVARFSLLATIAIAVVSAAGLAMSWLLVRTLPALVSTAYGRALLLKIGLAVLVMGVGAYNHRRLVPSVAAVIGGPTRLRVPVGVGGASAGTAGTAGTSAGTAGTPAGTAPGGRAAGTGGPDRPDADDGAGSEPRAPEAGAPGSAASDARVVDVLDAGVLDAGGAAWRRLWTTVRLEVVGLVAVAAVTAVVAGMQPAAEAAGVTGALHTSAAVGDGSRLSLTVDPNDAGYNEIHLFLIDDTGRPAEVTDLRLRLSMPDQDIGPIVRTPSTVAPGHWLHTGRELVVPGRWQIEAVIGLSQFEQQQVTFAVDVRL